MASTTVANLLTDVRFDLRDQGKQIYNDAYLIRMLNRGINVMERELITINSDLTVHRTQTNLSSGNNSMELDKTVDSIRRVYIGQVEIYHVSMEELYRRRIDVIGSTTGQPYYYSIWMKPSGSSGRSMVFDYTADQTYSIDYVYDKLTGDLTSTDYMPYDDMFNDYLREGIVSLCQKTKKKEMIQVDRVWRELFRNHMFQYSIAVNRTPKYRYIDI